MNLPQRAPAQENTSDVRMGQGLILNCQPRLRLSIAAMPCGKRRSADRPVSGMFRDAGPAPPGGTPGPAALRLSC